MSCVQTAEMQLLLLMFCGLCVDLLDVTMNCAKTDELIKMPFGFWSRVGPRNYLLGVDPDPPGEGAIFGRGSFPLQCSPLSQFFNHFLWLIQEDVCVPRLGPGSLWYVVHLRLWLVDISWRLQVCQESKRTAVQAARPAKGQWPNLLNILRFIIGLSQIYCKIDLR